LPKISKKFEKNHPNGVAKFGWDRLKLAIFGKRLAQSRYVSETMQDWDIVVTTEG